MLDKNSIDTDDNKINLKNKNKNKNKNKDKDKDTEKDNDDDKSKHIDKDKSKISKNETIQSNESELIISHDDVIIAANALKELRSNRSPSPSLLSSSLLESQKQQTIFDKMISHPIISNSINYVLEKTISSSNQTILSDYDDKTKNINNNNTITNNNDNIHIINNKVNVDKGKLCNNSNNNNSSNKPILPPLNSITRNLSNNLFNLSNTNSNSNLNKRKRIDELDPLENLTKRIKSSNNNNINNNNNSKNNNLFFKRNNSLRQQIAMSSVMTTQKSLEELKHLSTLNLNIESRKKLTMLIHFLKLGNSQLSERIENLIQNVDAKREKLGLESKDNLIHNSNLKSNLKSETNSNSNSNSEFDLNIQQIKADIVTTVKKIVNVVSKVSAQSLSEPARSNVREALLKLPTNWATMLNNESLFSLGMEENEEGEDEDEDEEEEEEEEEEEDEEDEEDEEYDEYEDAEVDNNNNDIQYNNTSGKDENIPTIAVNNTAIFKRIRKPSISRRLMTSLIQYRKNKGEEFDKNTKKLKKWFREKIKDQIMHDSSGKVLILAQESLDMINKIIKFCNESLDKADNWNTDRQNQHKLELLRRLQNINSINSQIKNIKDENVETIVVKEKKVTETAKNLKK
jgi:hypothetical protein